MILILSDKTICIERIPKKWKKININCYNTFNLQNISEKLDFIFFICYNFLRGCEKI